MALATIADYEAITGITVPDAPSPERTRIELLLELGSSAVLAGAGGQLITQTTNTSVLIQPYEGIGYLPQRPVNSITTVIVEGETLTANTDYRFEPGGYGRPAKLIRRVNGFDSWWTCELTVTYVSGWATIPGQVKAIVVAIAKSAVDNDGGAAPNSIALGGFAQGWDSPQQAGMALSPLDLSTIAQLCGVQGHGSAVAGRDQP